MYKQRGVELTRRARIRARKTNGNIFTVEDVENREDLAREITILSLS